MLLVVMSVIILVFEASNLSLVYRSFGELRFPILRNFISLLRGFGMKRTKQKINNGYHKRTIRNRLVDIMNEYKLSKDDLRDILGLTTRDQVDNYINGVSNLPIDRAYVLSQKLHLSLDYIYCVDDNRSRARNFRLSDYINVIRKGSFLNSDTTDRAYVSLRIPLRVHEFIKSVESVKAKTLHSAIELPLLNELKMKSEKKKNFVFELNVPLDRFVLKFAPNDNNEYVFACEYSDLKLNPSDEQKIFDEAFFDEIYMILNQKI